MSQQPAFRLATDSPHRPDPVDPTLAAKLADECAYQTRLDARLRAQEWADDDF
jgi:hypothetical protein